MARTGSRTSSAGIGLARNVLTNRLNWPVDHGIHKGRDMYPVFTTIRQWGDMHAAPDGPPLRLIRKDCGGSPRPYRGARRAAAERAGRRERHIGTGSGRAPGWCGVGGDT